MATINFPSSPVLNDQYSFEGKTWTFNGDGWVLTSTPTTLRIDAAFDQANTANTNANAVYQIALDAYSAANSANYRSACNEIQIDNLSIGIGIVNAQSFFASDAANSAYIHANAAFDTANLADPVFIQYVADLANDAWDMANTANAEVFLARFYACTAIQYADTVNQHLNVAYRHANSAYDYANTTNILAQAAFDTANSGGGATTDSWARDAANSAGVYANAAFDAANNATDSWVRDAANSASSYANSAYTEANTGTILAQAAFDTANNAVDTWVRDAANSASSYANSAYDQANTATQDANSAGVYANSAYAAANAAYALAQSGGTPLSGEFDYGLITDVNNTIQDYGTL